MKTLILVERFLDGLSGTEEYVRLKLRRKVKGSYFDSYHGVGIMFYYLTRSLSVRTYIVDIVILEGSDKTTNATINSFHKCKTLISTHKK